MGTREFWFRNLFRFAPWSVIPIHWKGWALLILGPLSLLIFGNMLADYPLIAASLIVIGVFAFMAVIYTHTTWDRG